jgi:hypothetical protein
MSILQGSSSGTSIGSDVLVQGGLVDSASAGQSAKISSSSNMLGSGGSVVVDGGSSGGAAGGSVAVTSGAGASASVSGGVAIATHSITSSTSGDVEVKSCDGVTMSGSVRCEWFCKVDGRKHCCRRPFVRQRQWIVDFSAERCVIERCDGVSVTIRSDASEATASGSVDVGTSSFAVGSGSSGVVGVLSGSASCGASESLTLVSGASTDAASDLVTVLAVSSSKVRCCLAVLAIAPVLLARVILCAWLKVLDLSVVM